jgi:NAD-dependent dihydropyrimidine dehydrogenase PreA subunit
MNSLKYIIVNIVETLVRVAPFPCKTGLIKIGNPDKNSPVILTCNYHLTVERVKNALRDIDCYLLVANSRGHNVWCGSTGGHFTNHSVISVLKTSGIEELVDHRKVILPQLAGTGIESRVIHEKTGWNVIWGPVYAKNIPFFIKNGFKKTPEMREVRFSLGQRIEMAAMWAFPFSIIAAIILIPFWRAIILPLTIFLWIFSISIFVGFPLYAKWLNPKKRANFSKYTVIFDFGRVPLLLWGIFILFLLIYSILAGTFTFGFISSWGFISFIILLILSIDLMGSTPTYKSGLHDDRFLKVILDKEKCKGAGFCEQVCPRNCFEVDKSGHTATMPRADQCVQCGACIVQCPFDALYFESPEGEIVSPEDVRRFKLNLIGKRLVKVK